VLAALALTGVGLSVADTQERSGELAELLDRVEAAQVTVALAERKLSSMQQYVRPVVASTAASSPTHVDLRNLVADVGAEGAVRVAKERSGVRETRMLPWHRAGLTARAAYLDYLDAKADHLRSVGAADQVLAAKKAAVDGARAEAVAALSGVASGQDQVARVEESLSGPWS
jgi:hypothetical protein